MFASCFFSLNFFPFHFGFVSISNVFATRLSNFSEDFGVTARHNWAFGVIWAINWVKWHLWVTVRSELFFSQNSTQCKCKDEFEQLKWKTKANLITSYNHLKHMNKNKFENKIYELIRQYMIIEPKAREKICRLNGQLSRKPFSENCYKKKFFSFFHFHFFQFSTQIAYCRQALILCGFPSASLLIANNFIYE